jgi:hypothetical protein
LGSWEIIIIGKEGWANISHFLWDNIIQSNAQAASLSLSIRDAEGGIRYGVGAHAARHKTLWVQPNFIEFKS